MRNKKLFISSLLIIFSSLFGIILGKIDFFGFLDGRHALHLTLLVLSIITAYIITILVFIIDFSDKKNLIIVYIASSIFFMIFYFTADTNFFGTVTAGFVFLFFLNFINTETQKRAQLFVKFIPQELFFPVLKKAVLFLIILFAIANFFQSQKIISENGIISPYIVKYVSRPIVVFFNNQISLQLRQQLGPKYNYLSQKEKKRIVEFVIKDIITQLSLSPIGKRISINPEHIEEEKVILYNDGSIDITPVVDSVILDITHNLNREIKQHKLVAPLFISLITIIIFQALFIPIQYIESIIALFLFKIMLSSGFLHIKKEEAIVERLTL